MLSDAFLAKLDAFSFHPCHSAAGNSGGMRRSKTLGSSVEFSDFRQYVPGDDLRRIDWNAYARFDRLFLKLFMDEKQQNVNLILDASASMGMGKWQAAVQLCQTLGYLCLCGGDSVTLHVLSGGGIKRLRTLSGRQNYPELSDFLEQRTPEGIVELDRCVPQLMLPQGRGMSLLVSDLLSTDGYQRALSSLLYRKQETSLLQLWSREEWEPQLEGAVELIDSESGEKLILNAGFDALKRYRETARAYVQEAETFSHAHGISYLFLIPEESFEEQMLRALSSAGLIA